MIKKEIKEINERRKQKYIRMKKRDYKERLEE